MSGTKFDGIIDTITTLRGKGELFAAIDTAKNALSLSPAPPLELRLLLVQIMARAGSLHEARHWYDKLGLAKEADIDSRSLSARLSKDLAYAAPAAQQQNLLTLARNKYLEIYEDTGDKYPGINAATLSVFTGDTKAAHKIASEILIAKAQSKPAHKGYWHYATLTEAYILTDQMQLAEEAIKKAATIRATSLSDRASTLQQLAKLLGALGKSGGTLAPLRPKPVLHYTGHMIAPPGKGGRILAENEDVLKSRIKAALAKIDAGIAYGSLASGADILIAECLLDAGAELNIVLPFDKQDFIDASVKPAGGNWVARFESCLSCSNQPEAYLTDQAYMGDGILFDLCAKMAMGRTLLRAKHTAGSAVQLAVWDGKKTDFPAGTFVDQEQWGRLGHKQHIVDVADLGGAPQKQDVKPKAEKKSVQTSLASHRIDAAMLFGDFKGFSKLSDTQLPSFVDNALGAAAQVLKAKTAGTDFVNTWGDGIFAVWANPAQAAECALDLQEALGASQKNLPIRISLHYGVAHKLLDPVLETENYFGEAVSRAARIEPITPTGAVYVTEPFAAMLMLDKTSKVSAEYVGKLESAKSFGQIELYRIYRKPNH